MVFVYMYTLKCMVLPPKIYVETLSILQSGREVSAGIELCWSLDLTLCSLQNREKISFHCLSHPSVYCILLQQLELPNTTCNKELGSKFKKANLLKLTSKRIKY